MTESRRSMLRVLTWFAAAALAAFLLTRLLDPGDSACDGESSAEAVSSALEPGLITSEPGLQPAGRPPEVGKTHPADTPLQSELPASVVELRGGVDAWPSDGKAAPGIAGYVEVRIEAAPDLGVAGEAYALPAGASGTDDIDDAPHATVGSDDPGRIPIAREGLYDVGFVWHGHALMQRDVRVARGRTTTVTFKVPRPEPVHVRLVDAPPAMDGWTVRATVALSIDRGVPSRPFPGRTESASMSWISRLESGSNSVALLLPWERATAMAFLTAWKNADRSKFKPLDTHVALCSASAVGPGDRLDVRIVRAARLRVHVKLDAASWPAGVGRAIRLYAHCAGRTTQGYRILHRPMSACDEYEELLELVVPPGTLRLQWKGLDVRSGERSGIRVEAAKTTDVELRVVFTGHASHWGAPLAIKADPPPGPPSRRGITLACLRREADGRPGLRTQLIDHELEDGEELDENLRHARTAIAVAGSQWVSGPLDVADAKSLHLRWRQGGHLVVVVEVDRPEKVGRMRLRRKDGLPLHRKEKGFAVAVEAATGVVLGPLLPGEHVFEVTLGGQRLSDVKATVHAGRTAPLVLPE